MGGFLAGALGLSIGNGTSSSPTTPANNAKAEPLVGRRREDEEGGEAGNSKNNESNFFDRANNWISNSIDSVAEIPGKIKDKIVDSVKEMLFPNIQIPTIFSQPGNLLNPNTLSNGIGLGNWIGSFNAESPSGPGNFGKIGNLFKGLYNIFETDSSNRSKVKPSMEDRKPTNERNTNEATSREIEDFSDRDASNFIIKPENIQAFKESVLTEYEIDKGYIGNNGFLTEKKLLMLEMSGVPKKEIADLEKSLKEKGYKKPTSKESVSVLREFQRTLDGKPLDPDPVFGKSRNTEEALSKVDFKKNPLETESKYIMRVGEEIHRATQGMTFDSQEDVNLHIAKVAEKLATIGDSIKYGNNTSDPFDTRPMNMVGDAGYKYPDSGQTDCNRFVASVLYTSGFFPPSAFSNLNQDVYLTPDDAKRRNADFIQTSGGVVFLREASLLFEKVGDNLTHSSLGKLAGKEAFGKEPFVGSIGITRQNFTSKTTKQNVLKSDHVYIITDKRTNPTTGKTEYRVAESHDGKNGGIDLRWLDSNHKYFQRSEYYKYKAGVN